MAAESHTTTTTIVMRKRASPVSDGGGGSPYTLQKRTCLKLSFEAGDVHVYHSSLPQLGLSCSALVQSDNVLQVLNRSTKLGKGVYGEAMLLEGGDNHTLAAKVTSCFSSLVGSYGSPFRSENVEPRMLQLLWEYIVQPGRSPHIIMPYGKHVVVDGYLPGKHKKDAGVTSSAVFLMEHASGSDVRAFLGYTAAVDFDRVFLSILFQLCYTFQAIYEVFPNFRHNDTQDSNVFLHATPTVGHTRYTILGGGGGGSKTFYVPNSAGASVLLADADFSCISGLVDNYKVLEQAFDTPSFNINSRKDHASDIYLFVKYTLASFSDKMSTELKKGIYDAFDVNRAPNASVNVLDVFTNANGELGNSYRLPGHCVQSAPTVAQLLWDTSLFDAYLAPLPDDAVTASFRATPLPPGDPDVQFPPWSTQVHVGTTTTTNASVVRYAPIMLPRFNRKDFKMPPSMRNFFSWPTDPPTLDTWNLNYVTTYKPTYTRPILEVMYAAYSHREEGEEDGDENNSTTHAYPEDKWPAFSAAMVSRASSFIDTIEVPKHWWMAAFTCAFVDVAWEMGLTPPGQFCWYIDKWCEFWTQVAEGRQTYSPDQLLHFTLQWSWYRQSE